MNNNGKVILGMAAAAAAGAVIGMMFAPEKGSDLRDKVRETANGLATDLLDSIQKGRNQYNQTAQQIEDEAENLKSKAVGKIAEVKDRIETKMENVTDKFNS
jgi:gas vesicle protein